jgi:receptor protein-tyrosine kinase
MKLMDESGVPERPSNPLRARFYALIGGSAAFGIVLVLLFLYAVTRMTVRSEKDLKILFNVPALGAIPSVRMKKRSRKKAFRIAVDQAGIPYFFIESFRAVRNRLEKEMSERGFQTLLVTSALPSEGKSTVAVNLALSLAHKGRKVILADLDLRNPSVGRALQVEETGPGAGDVLEGKASLKEALVSYRKNPNLVLLPGRGSLQSPAELLNTDAFRAMLGEMKKAADYVILDTPPSAVVSDASIIAKSTDACVYVVRQDYAKLDSLQEGMDMMAGTGAAVVGTVLNGIETTVFSGGYGYGYYSYGSYGRYGYSPKKGYYGYQGYGEKTGGKEDSPDIQNK